ncbi:MAG: PolC-type DNA polymerase III [Candidatus Goldbacteria bacterium]|nr:PolC-type DNA polymerase III [Candidatus Goldiibacteriota bacterium]
MSSTFILDIDDEEIKNLIKQKLDDKKAPELDFIKFLFMEINDYDSKNSIDVYLVVKKLIKKEILITIKTFMQDKIGKTVKFNFQFDGAIEAKDKLQQYWNFFCDKMDGLKSWLDYTAPIVENNKIIINCENPFIFTKLREQKVLNKIKQKLNEFFNVKAEIDVAQFNNAQQVSDIISQKIEKTVNSDMPESEVLTNDFITGTITPVEEIVKDGKYIIEGRVFYDSKNMTKGLKKEKDRVKLFFYLTNERDTIKIIAFLDKDDGLIECISNIEYARLLVNVKYNENEEELVAYLKKINKLQKPKIIDNAVEKRVELHAHTMLSAMDSVLSVEDYIDTAIDCGHRAIAITDHGVVHSFPGAYKYIKDKKRGKLKLILGMEGYLIDNEEKSRENVPYHIIILVKNYTGLKNLYKLVSNSHLKYFYKKPRILRKELIDFRDGLLFGSACNQGELFNAIMEKKPENKIEEIVKFYDYLEIQPKCNNHFLINKKTVASEEELNNINKRIYQFGKKFNKPVVATGDVHFLKKEDKVYREVLLFGQGYDDFAEGESADLSFKTTDWMLDEFSYLGEKEAKEVVVENSNLICDLIDDNIMPVPDKPCPPQIKGAEDEIVQITWSNAKSKYGENIPEIINNRIKKELDAIISNNYATLYYLAKKMVEQSLKDGYIVGSRGSVGSSLVAFLCGITEVNPLPAHYLCNKCKYVEFLSTDVVGVDLPDKICPACNEKLVKDGYNIPFETFMGFQGEKMPDIDLNFSGEYQERMHKFVIDFFGSERVFRAGTIVTMQEQAIKKDFIDKYLSKMKTKRAIRKAEKERLAKGCSGVKRSTGQHAGGLMLVPEGKEIYDFTPIQYSPGKDAITTHFEYKKIHDTLVKVDALGHDLPTSLKRLCSELNISVEQIPLNDKKTMKLFSDINVIGVKKENYSHSVGVLGIPEYGTRATREILEFTKPKTFSELIYISGISHGTNVWHNNAYDLIKNKTATLSRVITVRDDIMNFLISRGLPPDRAFNIMESVRKGVGLTEQDEELMVKHKVPDWYITSCKKIKYLFPKAHATAYAIMSFRIAYIKVHYPLYFYADYFTREKSGFEYEYTGLSFDDVKNMLQSFKIKYDLEKKEEDHLKVLEVLLEAKERGVKFLNVDLYESEAEVFKVKGDKILPPLVLIPELGEKIAESIVRERKNGKFLSIENLLKRTRPKPNKNTIQFMKENKILDLLPESDQAILF